MPPTAAARRRDRAVEPVAVPGIPQWDGERGSSENGGGPASAMACGSQLWLISGTPFVSKSCAQPGGLIEREIRAELVRSCSVERRTAT
jgi:hypothetical protein